MGDRGLLLCFSCGPHPGPRENPALSPGVLLENLLTRLEVKWRPPPAPPRRCRVQSTHSSLSAKHPPSLQPCPLAVCEAKYCTGGLPLTVQHEGIVPIGFAFSPLKGTRAGYGKRKRCQMSLEPLVVLEGEEGL